MHLHVEKPIRDHENRERPKTILHEEEAVGLRVFGLEKRSSDRTE